MKEIFVFGHRNPDTDSVCSAIALSYLKNQQGFTTTPKILSDINKESKFALKYFGIKKPDFINDVKVRVKDINYETNALISEEESVDRAFEFMAKFNVTALPLVDSKCKLTGYLSLKDIARYLSESDNNFIDTSLINIINSLDAKVVSSLDAKVVSEFDEKIKGNVIVASLDSETFLNEITLDKNTILISGFRKPIIDKAIDSKVKLIIISCNQKLDTSLVEKARANKVNILRTEHFTFNIANKIHLSNFTMSINTNTSPVVLSEDDFYSDFLDLTAKNHFSNYPVVNKKGICKGLIKVTGENNYDKQEVILVDHNTFSQSAVGVDEANILEIVDHHNLGAINTVLPISFRSMPVGCTSTIIYIMFSESKIDIPSDIAGLMLSAIISDTLLFTSPTTTDKDIDVANKLALIANVDIDTYGRELLKAASSIKGMSIEELVYTDYKSYTYASKEIGISVVTTMDFDAIAPKVPEILKLLESKIEIDEYNLSVMFATDVIKNGSYLIYNEDSAELLKDAFNLDEIYQGVFIPSLVSRKKQMLPHILEVL